ncbi:MAG: UvrD-helicase domain-containing protein [Magnetococcales bacterium]|nr:UvrD-helicase domain-containing protein [Magnetococcales bacterium]
MTGVPADAAVRESAIDPNRSFIVQAPAGSGKTGLLTQRFLVLLTRVRVPEEVVAITFTRKAAAEMKGRILKALIAAAEGGEPAKDPFSRRLHELALAVLACDREHQWNLLENPGRLRLMTMDALNLAIASRLPVVSGFGGFPRVGDEQEILPLYQQAARAALATAITDSRWAPAAERLLDHLDNDLARVQSLLAELLPRRDLWLPHVVPQEGGGGAREKIEATLAAIRGRALTEASAAFPEDYKSMVLRLAKLAALHLQAESAGEASTGGASRRPSCLESWLEVSRFPGRRPEDFEHWLGLAKWLLTREGGWRKRVDRRQGFLPPSEGRSGQEKAMFRQVREDMLDLLASLAHYPRCRERLAALRELPPATYDEDSWSILSALVGILPMAAAELDLLFAARGIVDHPRLAMAARFALGPPEAPTDLALALDHRLQHLLVDEFQDTSKGQWQLLERLTAGWDGSDGRTLFLVGDPMQSIYRFREAEVGLFLQARRTGLGTIPLGPLSLSVNFRSDGGLIDWINQAFVPLFPGEEDAFTGAVPYSPSEAFHAAVVEVPVTLHSLVGDGDSTREAESVLEVVTEALAREGESIAILVRSRSHLAQIVPTLTRAGIPFQAVEIDSLGQRPEVRDLLALTRALLHPADRLSWLAILRAPWCGLTLNELHALAGQDHEAVIADLWRSPHWLRGMSLSGRQRLERVRTIITAALESHRRVLHPRGGRILRPWIEGVWIALGGPASLATPKELENAETFLDLLDQLDDGGEVTDFQRLEAGVERLFATPEATPEASRLKLMTIHKAKGLEFHTVLLPGLGRSPRGESRELLSWLEPVEADSSQSPLLAPIPRTGDKEPEPIGAFIRSVHKRRAAHESARLFYVAATRARRHLHLFGNIKSPGSPPRAGSLLAEIWSAVEADFRPLDPGAGSDWNAALQTDGREESAADALLRPQPATPPRPLLRLPNGYRLPPPPPPLLVGRETVAIGEPTESVVFDWAGEEVRLVGIVVHRFLKIIAEEGIDQWTPKRIEAAHGLFRAQLTHLGLADVRAEARGEARSSLGNAVLKVARALQLTLEDPRGSWILDDRHQDCHNEYPLTAATPGGISRVVVDRTFIDTDGVRWVIDYKTGIHDAREREAFLDNEFLRYRQQLTRYGEWIRHLEPRRRLRLGLYFPMLQGWREWALE